MLSLTYHTHLQNDAVAESLSDLQMTDPSSIFWVLMLGVVFYHHTVKHLLGVRFDWLRGFRRFYEMKKRHATFSLCPNRAARYAKCAKRCAARRHARGCMIVNSVAKFTRVHMPPPLPWRKRTKPKALRLKMPAPAKAEEQHQDAAEEQVKDPQETSSQQVRPGQAQSQLVTPLIDLARMQNWDLIRTYATRKAAKQRDSDGLMPLHWAVSGGPPLDVVETLLKVYPSAARKLDKEASTALHFAAHYAASPSVIDALLKACPRAAGLQDRFGRSPLYHAVDKSLGMDALNLLVQADPSMVTTPCLREEHRALPLTRTTASVTPLYVAWSYVVTDRSIKKINRCKRMEKAQLLLEAAFFHAKNVNPSVPRDYHVISSAVAMDIYLPSEVLSMAIKRHPKDLEHADENGRVALAQAAASNQYSNERADTMIHELLRANAGAVSLRGRDGRFPLQLALAAGKTWTAGISRLFGAFPEALGWDDTRNGLPAFATAASAEAHAAAPIFTDDPQDVKAMRPMRNADPYNMLSAKRQELLCKRHNSDESAQSFESFDPDAERLTTILDLLRADPAALR